MEYRPRVADAAMQELLSALGAVLVEGPRGCGKTTTALRHARSSVRLDGGPSVLELAALDPVGLLAGPTPRLVDEWQLQPDLWNVVRHEIDTRRESGQFILSGSAVPGPDPTRHSGAGRFGRLRMRPMTLAESGHTTGAVSFAALVAGAHGSGRSSLTYTDLAAVTVAGGWPALLRATQRQAVAFNRAYLDDVCASSIPLATGVRHDPIRMRRLLQAVARNVATEVTVERLTADVAADGAGFDRKTTRTYLDALSTIFVLDELPAWSVALRSKSRLRTSPKIHLVDPALACAALGVNADRLARDPEFFGQVFESLVTRDVRSLVESSFGRTYHYRDSSGLEIDLIVEFADGTWAAIEIKLGAARIDAAEANLLALRDSRIDTDRVGTPAFLAVITGTEHAYTRPSGVHIVPIGALAV